MCESIYLFMNFFLASSTRLQFRLPDGSSSVKEFSSQTSLGEVCQYIKNSLTEGSANFKLCTAFPRHDFTTSEYSMSLIELQLVPSAVLLVIPMQVGSSVEMEILTCIFRIRQVVCW